MNKTVAIAMLPPDPMNFLTDGSFTYHMDKYSCMKGMYEAHRKCVAFQIHHMRKHVFGAFPDTYVCSLLFRSRRNMWADVYRHEIRSTNKVDAQMVWQGLHHYNALGHRHLSPDPQHWCERQNESERV